MNFPWKLSICTNPVMPIASERLSPAAVVSSRSSSNPTSARLPPTRQIVAHNKVRGGYSHLRPGGLFDRELVGHLSRPLPTQPGTSDVTVCRPRPGSHMPVEGRMQIIGSLQVGGDQRGILLDRRGFAVLDGGGNMSVQLCAAGFQLRFVGDGANQRMPERKFRRRLPARRARHPPSAAMARSPEQVASKFVVKPRADHRRSVECLFGVCVETVDAGGDGGLHRRRHSDVAAAPADVGSRDRRRGPRVLPDPGRSPR